MWEEHGEKSAQELVAIGIMQANVLFWHAANMAAQCSVWDTSVQAPAISIAATALQ